MSQQRKGDCIFYRRDDVQVAPEDVASVFTWLKTWEIAAPLKAYSHLAKDEGTSEERDFTLQLIKDLRQPVYDSRAVWIRKCPASEQFLDAWREERDRCICDGGCDLPFLRALWRVKPLILALPVSFIV